MKKPIPFGKYYLLDRINVGGMAEVFKAKAFGVEGFERLLAVKRILPNIAEDEEFITMFIDEAKIAVQLNHANIAQIFDLGKVDDSYFIALEYIHGKDLRAIFDRCRASGENMPIAQACFIIMKVCEGLDYAHNKRDASGRGLNLVHRDVSPQNVLISYEGEVKLIDFGIAKAAGKASKTQAGILKGKFGYMSPEQVRGLPLTRVSDIFSVGIVLYELLTGERLFIGESDFSTLEKVRNVEILPPSTYNRKIPEELERIVLKALAKDPEDRYGNAIDLHDELQAFMYTAGEFYSRKDLAAWQKRTFSREIQEETQKLEEYRHLQPPAPPARAAAPPPPNMAVPPPSAAAYGEAANVSSTVDSAAPDLDWDDDEIETQLYDRDVPPSMLDDFPAPAPAAGGLPPPGGLPRPSGQAPPPRKDAALKKTLMGMGGAGPVDLPQPTGAAAHQPAGEPIVDPFAVSASPEPEPMDPIAAATAAIQEQHAVSAMPPAASASDLAPRTRKAKGGGLRIFLILFSVVLILGASGAAVWYFVLREKPKGTLKVRVSQPEASIYIDDSKKEHRSPLSIDLKPGPHVVTIRKLGYETLVKEVEIKAGQEKELLLSLKSAVVGKGTFDVISTPKGSSVVLDGKVLAEKTNIRIEVAAGAHTIQLRYPGYHPWPLDKPHRFVVKPGSNPKLKQTLIPRRLQLVISAANVKRNAAKFSVYKDGAKVLSGTVPKTTTIRQVDPKASYRVVISAKGYPAWSKKLVLGGSDEISVHAPFAGREVSSSMGSVYTPPPRTTMRYTYTPPAMREDPPRPMIRVMRPIMAAGGGGFGILRINTRPWTKVYVDGKLKGTTPLMKIKLKAGRHKVTMLNNNKGIRKTIWVTIPAKGTKTVIKRFE